MKTMNQKKVLTFWLLVLVGLTLVGCNISWQPSVEDNVEQEVNVNPKLEAPQNARKRVSEGVIANAVNAKNYQAFTQELLKEWLESWKQVVLFFSADWCPLCVKLDENLKANLASIPNDVVFLTIDYDKWWDLLDEYEIYSQHTLVYLDSAWNILLSNVKKEVSLEQVLETIGTFWDAWDQNVDNEQDQPADLNKNNDLIAAREEETQQGEINKDDSWNSQTITASEVLYPAKVWDSIEAHPARLTVSITLDGEIITWLDLDQQSSSPKSARHQAQFAQQIESKVIGKKLSESNSVYISSASSTSTAFNQSINEIQELYKQSQL